ncbi:hypothetical protein BDV19DRAFT_362780 [Aspergillus venezuelensis]
MPNPERQRGQTSWARRQQQQQHTSPFRRARPDSLHLDASNGLSPPRESPDRHRRNFSQTGTLRGAFEFASRLPLAEIEDDLFLTGSTQQGSPYKRRRSTSAMSSLSNPPELDEAYKQIDDANSLTDLDLSDGENALHRGDKLSRRIPTPRKKQLSTGSDVSFTSDSSRRRFTDYAKDEERLKRATTSRSPVLDRAALGNGTTSDHLVRRESESNSVSEEDYGIEPAMKAPATWGSRARHGNNWMKSLTRSHERTESNTEEFKKSPPRFADEMNSRRGQRLSEDREVELERPKSRHGFSSTEAPSVGRIEDIAGGQRIPNTPISIFPSSTFTKRSPTKRDSHDLLRKLARSGSPNQTSTAALQTPEQTTGRRIYDKTPVVTGAWIDTPVTERVPASERRDPLRMLGSKMNNTWSLDKLEEEPNEQDDVNIDAEGLIPNFEPMKKDAELSANEPKQEQKGSLWSIKDAPEGNQLQEIDPNQDLSVRKAAKSKEPEGDVQKQEPVKLPLPDHPKSALETVLQEHQNNKDSLDVSDDTLESLQAIMDQQPSEDTGAQEEDDAAYEQQVIGELESAQPSELKDFDRIEGKLQSLSDTMSNLKSGLNQLGNRVSRDTEQIIASLNRSPDKTEFESGNPEKGCQCKPRSNGVMQYGIPLPRLWTRGSVWWMTRPTRLGWCTLVVLAWYLSESTMCDQYCHPRVDTICEGNCLRPDAPRFPFVIPTMVSRWLHLSDILLPLWAIILAFFKIFSRIMGLSDGYVDDEPPKLNLTGKIWIDGTQIDSLPTATATATGMGFIPPVAQWAWREPTQVPEPLPDIVPKPSAANDWDDISMDEDEFL